MWGINTVVTYPTPLKKGRIGIYSVIVWEIPPVINLLKLTSDKGLTKKDENLKWDYFDKMNNTIIFSLYLKTLKKVEQESLMKVNVSHFQGINPLEIIEHMIEGHPLKIG
jgi:hypothetical protein